MTGCKSGRLLWYNKTVLKIKFRNIITLLNWISCSYFIFTSLLICFFYIFTNGNFVNIYEIKIIIDIMSMFSILLITFVLPFNLFLIDMENIFEGLTQTFQKY